MRCRRATIVSVIALVASLCALALLYRMCACRPTCTARPDQAGPSAPETRSANYLNNGTCEPRSPRGEDNGSGPHAMQSAPPVGPMAPMAPMAPTPALFTHGIPSFTQIGLLETAGKEPIALFGRRTRRGGDRWNYYAVTNNYTPQKLPVFVAGKECARLLGCAELSDGDTADVRGYGAARVTLYTLDDAESQFRLRA